MKKLLRTIWRNDNITQKKLLHISILLIVTYILIFHVFYKLVDHYDFIHSIDKVCFLPCDKSKCKAFTHKVRGDMYYVTTGDNSTYSCLFTIWEFTHLLFHIVIGYYLDLRYSLAIGIPFEIFEHNYYKCESYIDLMCNTAGACIGGYLRYRNDNSKLNNLYY